MPKRFRKVIAAGLGIVLLIGAGISRGQGPAAIKSSDPAAALSATEEVLKMVSQLRGLDIRRPVKSAYKSQAEIEQSVIRDLDENTTPEEFAATSKTLLKLGLTPAGFQLRDYMVKLLREQVAGYYDPKTQEFYLAAWLPVSEQKTVMAHELTHALQDQHFNLRRFEKWPKGDSDAELAAHALFEGEATIVMFLYAVEQEGRHLDVSRMDSLTETLLGQGDDADASKYPVLATAPAVLRENLQFPYVYGAGFVQAVVKNRSWAGIDSTYARLPASSKQIIHPERFLSRDDTIRIELADAAGALGPDWKRIDSDVNGEFGYTVLLGQFIDKRTARVAADGWAGDRYALFENKASGALALTQFTTWDTLGDAKEFFQAYCERTAKRYSRVHELETRPDRRTWQTEENLVAVELRGKDVVVIEGAQDQMQLARTSERLWQSHKAARSAVAAAKGS